MCESKKEAVVITTVRMSKWVLVSFLIFISILFVLMIRKYLVVLLLAGIFAAILQPVFNKTTKLLRGRKNAAAALTLVIIILLILLPVAGLLFTAISQAHHISNEVKPWIQEKMQEPTAFTSLLQHLPFYDFIAKYNQIILQKAGEMVGGISSMLVAKFKSLTLSAIHFFFFFFLFLYAVFFFLKEGGLLLEKMLYYIPLNENDKQRILHRFTSVTRATLKGTFVIGLMQGSLNGFAFWIAGIDGALFWGACMSLLSVLPAIGSSIIWIPAVLILAAYGAFTKAVLLWIFCGFIVGSLDNVLRPIMVGKDAQMHQLLILFSTLGGLSLFGIVGIIIGPVIAALFVTIWEIYGETFKRYLPLQPVELPEIKTEPKQQDAKI
jgi:predicted PurR-regulated permease PerM